MSNFYTVIKKLLPKGRAYRLKDGSQHKQLMEALGEEPKRIETFFDKVKSSGIPNGNLPAEALSDWETFLALPTNSSLSNIERNERIKGKYTAQGGQGPDYIEQVMQDAGFPVYVVENTSGVDPRPYLGELIAGPTVWTEQKILDSTLGNMTLGAKKLGAYLGTRILTVDPVIPSDSDTWYYVWFLTGPSGLGDVVSIDADKEQDFRNRVLQIKPAHTWVVAQVNFI